MEEEVDLCIGDIECGNSQNKSCYQNYPESKKSQFKRKNNSGFFTNHQTLLISISFIIVTMMFSKLGYQKVKNFRTKVNLPEFENEEDYLKWEPKGTRIKTKWGENLDPRKVWQEYPRPQLERGNWTNLNGLWEYSITSNQTLQMPEIADGKILVPFPVESSLSGVMKRLTENQKLWYRKKIAINEEWKVKAKVFLHFEAVDWKTIVYINNAKVGEHYGGYYPFYFEIKRFINFNYSYFNITVEVYDPTDKGFQAIGKQSLSIGKGKHSPISGIWQTVWIEATSKVFIKNVYFVNYLDRKFFELWVETNTDVKLPCEAKLYYKDKLIHSNNNYTTSDYFYIYLNNEDIHPWTPETPNLYNFEISIYLDSSKSYLLDKIKSYSVFRKIRAERDKNNKMRFTLNNKPYFHIGILDQGYWPDGLYTPPSEEAVIFELNKIKEMGFNTIRKSSKLESSRYYYNCDKLGIMIWQDMPSGDMEGNIWEPKKMKGGTDKNRSIESKKNYLYELGNVLFSFKFFRSIVLWIPFNEGKGQFSTENIPKFIYTYDDTRPITCASGGNHRKCGNVSDIHSYPIPNYYLKVNDEVNVFGEYGGIGYKVNNHTWSEYSKGHFTVRKSKDVSKYYEKYALTIIAYVREGISGAIYTQFTDCENENDGLLTYDRKVVKVNEEFIRDLNIRLINTLI